MTDKTKTAKSAAAPKRGDAVVANPPRGMRGDFIPLTIKLPPDVYDLVTQEVSRRKREKAAAKPADRAAIVANPTAAGVIRDAIVQVFGGK